MGGKLQQTSKEISGGCWDILRKFLHSTRAINSMSNSVMRKVLHQTQKLWVAKGMEITWVILGFKTKGNLQASTAVTRSGFRHIQST